MQVKLISRIGHVSTVCVRLEYWYEYQLRHQRCKHTSVHALIDTRMQKVSTRSGWHSGGAAGGSVPILS